MQESDHDLLIRLSEKLDGVRDSIRDLAARTAGKADIKEVLTLEKRVALVESKTDEHDRAITAAGSSVKTVGAAIGYLGGLMALVYHLFLLSHKL
jgi:hypothetical protein